MAFLKNKLFRKRLLAILPAVACLVSAASFAEEKETKAEFSDPEKQAFEGAPVLKVRDVARPELMQSANYTVSEEVSAPDFFFHGHMDSRFGAYDVDSLNLLYTRAHECNVLVETLDVTGQNEFVKAVGTKLSDSAKAAKNTITSPVQTAKAVGNEVEQRSRDVWDFVRRKDRNQPKEPLIIGEDKRKLASSLHLDMYSTNPAVQEFLNHVARARTAGSALVGVSISVSTIVVPVALPISLAVTVVQTREGVADKLDKLSPIELYRYNDKILKKEDVSSSLREAFFSYPQMTPRQKTEIVADLQTLESMKDRSLFVSIAIEDHPGQGVWQVQCADMLAKYNKENEPIQEVHSDGAAVTARTAKGLLVVFPCDILYWNEVSAKAFKSELLQTAHAGEKRECVIAGTVTPVARKEIESRSFTIRDNFLAAQ